MAARSDENRLLRQTFADEKTARSTIISLACDAHGSCHDHLASRTADARRFRQDYYYLNVNNLGLVALTAVKMGAQYLPTDPPAAIRVADAYAQHHGIAPTEIVLTELSPDKSVLTIRLERKIPQYLAVLAMGGLPARDINVTASAWRQRSVGHPFGTQIIDASARWRRIDTSTY